VQGQRRRQEAKPDEESHNQKKVFHKLRCPLGIHVKETICNRHRKIPESDCQSAHQNCDRSTDNETPQKNVPQYSQDFHETSFSSALHCSGTAIS